MRKTLLLIVFIALGMALYADNNSKRVILPGKGKLDVERFNKEVNLKTDLSKLSLAELRVLKNAFKAREGFIFKEADLRGIYGQTSWYDSIMWNRADNLNETLDENNPNDWGQRQPTLTIAEQTFLRKIEQQEKKILNNKAILPKGQVVNLDLLLNPYQLETFDPRLHATMSRQGFAIVPERLQQLFHVYEKNDYSNFPSFVTTDLYLQLFHFYFDNILRDTEEKKLDSLVTAFSRGMFNRMTKLATTPSTGKQTKAAAAFCQAYFAVAIALSTGKTPAGVTAAYKQHVASEIKKVKASENTYSTFLGYTEVKYPYSLYRPRGHYSRSERIKHYFRTMMWLQSVPFGTDKPDQLKRAMLIAHVVGSDPQMKSAYNALFEPITFLFGEPDNITIMQVYDLMQGAAPEKVFVNEQWLNDIAKRIDEVGEKQTRIRPKVSLTSRNKINLMPQRYMPDAEVLNEMVDEKHKPTKRDVPSGLDVFAALGTSAAERILVEEQKEDKRWEGFLPTLKAMKQRMKEIDWNSSVANRWVDALAKMNKPVARAPYFMLTTQWEKKNLNTALASWAELKHDAILYAKQPMGAECGDAGPPEPIVKGYVEPNVPFWKKAVELMTQIDDVFKRYKINTPKMDATTERVKEMAEFLLRISEKELSADPILTDEEYQSIEIIGSTVENISLDLVRNDNQYLDGWDNVEGADKSVAVVADIYTANMSNNPVPSILYAGTGPAFVIYVAVPVGNELYLMRGAVLSYRELKQSTDQQRLTDEEWQEKLKTKPYLGVPKWMDEITVPLDNMPLDNEEMFYSSGC